MRDYSVKLDRVRRLVFDFDAWDRISDRFVPKDVDKGQDPVSWVFNNMNITAREVPPLLWIGMLWEDPQLTEIDVRLMLNQAIREGKKTMMDFMLLTVEALTAQAGVKTLGPGDKPPGDEVGEQKKDRAPRPRIPGSRKRGA